MTHRIRSLFRARTRALLIFALAIGGGIYAAHRSNGLIGYLVSNAIAGCGMPVVAALGTQPAGTYTDNGAVFGSQKVTINGVVYICDDIDITGGSKRIETTDENGVPNRQAFMDEVPNGSATLQLSGPAIAAPARYSIVSFVPIGGGTAITYIISEVGSKQESAGVTKVPIKFYQQLGSTPAQPA